MQHCLQRIQSTQEPVLTAPVVKPVVDFLKHHVLAGCQRGIFERERQASGSARRDMALASRRVLTDRHPKELAGVISELIVVPHLENTVRQTASATYRNAEQYLGLAGVLGLTRGFTMTLWVNPKYDAALSHEEMGILGASSPCTPSPFMVTLRRRRYVDCSFLFFVSRQQVQVSD
ncbi:hypothetical protein DIPPA_35294 [Diplonema papillatum]|nr:hypothetical protein DIPPA_35294 [Diplonema papillatum]